MKLWYFQKHWPGDLQHEAEAQMEETCYLQLHGSSAGENGHFVLMISTSCLESFGTRNNENHHTPKLLSNEDSGSEKQSELGLTRDDSGWDGILADEPDNHDPDYEMDCNISDALNCIQGQGPTVMNGPHETMV
ncbi:hypothetical protein K438DRAFT_1749580 [Mycena galopus ATCC 62051]|nr:hypothetical protein K438DRAFT_1749580 [Mycena galopus ATCC 62051]